MTIIARAALAAGLASVALPAVAEEWNVSLWGARRAFTEHVEKLAELVSEKTGGEFTLAISYGGLSGERENLDGLSIGAFEMAQFCAGYHEDKNPTLMVAELPFLGVDSLEEERAVSEALYAHPAVQEDLARWNATLLMPTPQPQYNIIGKGEPPRSLDEFDGLNVRATGGIGTAMASVGAVPTSMTASEVRQAMDAGVIRAAAFAPHAHMSFGLVEASDWWTTNLNPGTVNCPVAVNTDALEALSDEHREALLGSVDEALEHYIDHYTNETLGSYDALLESEGVERVSFEEEELARFREEVAGPATEAWIAGADARGLPGQELYDLVAAAAASE